MSKSYSYHVTLTPSEYLALVNVLGNTMVKEPTLVVVNCSVDPPVEITIGQLFARIHLIRPTRNTI